MRTFATLLALMRGTVANTGLQVKAFLIDKVYETGLKAESFFYSALTK